MFLILSIFGFLFTRFPQPVDSNQNKVKPPDAQHFLSLHHSTLQKDEDPRTKFSRTSSSSSTTASNARSSNVVGPMGSSALSLPSVEKVVNDGSKDGYVSAGRDERSERPREKGEKDRERHRDRDGRERESDRATPRISRKVSIESSLFSFSVSRSTMTYLPCLSSTRSFLFLRQSPTSFASSKQESRSQRLESPSLGSSNGPSSSSPGSTSPGGPRQSEVLHDFFQSCELPKFRWDLRSSECAICFVFSLLKAVPHLLSIFLCLSLSSAQTWR